ncbi:MAG: flippase-like domain-containing protein [Acidobacteria bacterium]|nr:flippase-like domain-containing protein [Acidobacteriota bacterium]
MKIAAGVFTLFGIGLFVYFIVNVGYEEILAGIAKIGFDGFALILALYFLRLFCRACAWKLSVYAPYRLALRDTLPAVVIGEAMSTMLPLGILVSGTAKAIAVRKKMPLVVGLSSIATENLFYSLMTGLFIAVGGFAFLRSFDLPDGWRLTVDVLIGLIFALIVFGFVMVLRQWHFASELCEKLYEKGYGRRIFEKGRMHVRLFENLIYAFYRQYPRRFLPIILFEAAFHLLGICEIWFILTRVADGIPTFFNSFLLESISRVILTMFKLIPFAIGVEEAGAQFVTETLALGVGIGAMVTIIRKGRTVFWTLTGVLLIVTRGLSIREFTNGLKKEEEKRSGGEEETDFS